jgi:hypothetical protein
MGALQYICYNGYCECTQNDLHVQAVEGERARRFLEKGQRAIAIDERKSKHVNILLHYCPCNTILYTLHAFRRYLSHDHGSQFPTIVNSV